VIVVLDPIELSLNTVDNGTSDEGIVDALRIEEVEFVYADTIGRMVEFAWGKPVDKYEWSADNDLGKTMLALVNIDLGVTDGLEYVYPVESRAILTLLAKIPVFAAVDDDLGLVGPR